MQKLPPLALRSNRWTLSALTFAALLAAAPLAQAADCFWTGGTGDWGVAANWDCGRAAGAADDAFMTNNDDVLRLSGGSAAVRSMYLSGGRLDISGGAVLSTTSDMAGQVVWIGDFFFNWAREPRADLRVTGTGSLWQAQWSSIVVGNGATGAVTVDSGGEVSIRNLSFVLGTNGGNGTLAIGALPGQPPAAPGTVTGSNPGVIELGEDARSTGRLVFNHTNTGDYAFTRNLTGYHGELLHLAGVTRLKPDADSAVAGHIFTGSARVTGATLVLNSGLFVARADTANGIDGGITVESGGTLAGEATVGDANGKFATPITVQAGGTLIPGTLNSASGTLTVAEGGVTAQAGATLRFGLDNADNSRLAAAGPIDLGGATLALELAPGFAPAAGQQWTLVDNTGAAPVQGRFAQGTTISLPGYAFEIDYAGGDGNDVVLKLVAAPAPGGGGRVAAVPTLGEWSLLLLGLLAAGLGARRLRRAGWRAAGGRSGAREGGCY